MLHGVTPVCSLHLHWLMPAIMQVRRAKEHVAQGEENLRQAKKLSKNTRKWMCCALIVLLIIAAIIVVVIIFQTGVVGGNKKKRLM